MQIGGVTIFLFVLIIAASEDLGVALQYIFIFVIMAFVGGVNFVWFLGALGARCITLSPELGSAALRDIARTAHGALSAVAYGKLPLMHTVRCMMHDPLRCRRGSGGFSGKIRPGEACREYITDRKSVKFFVVGNRDCTNTVFNSVPVWTADNPSAIRGRGIAEHFVFTDESADRVRGVIGAYRTGRAPDFPVRRIK